MPFIKEMDVFVLLDIYGALLTDRQREMLAMYYDEDFSLSEIAENLSISRQAAMDSIKRGEARLREYEQRLGMRRRMDEAQAIADRIEEKDTRGEFAGEVRRIRALW